MPKLSIITPCYNSEAFIGRTIESVRRQTFTDWEHIVVDDGSTDSSASVVDSYLEAEPRLRLISQFNRGVCAARNKGFSACSDESDYLLFLDADDCLASDMLSLMVQYLENNLRAGAAFCDCIFIDVNDRFLPTNSSRRFVPSLWGVRQLQPTEVNTPFMAIFGGARLLPGNVLLRRSIFAISGGWDTGFGQHHEDLDLFLRIALNSEFHYIPQTLFHYRRYFGQSSVTPERIAIQTAKFEKRWRQPHGLSEAQSTLVNKAWHFASRLSVYDRIYAGNACLRKGKVIQAARHYVWAARRFFLTMGWPFKTTRRNTSTKKKAKTR